jgi:hypothetical protein
MGLSFHLRIGSSIRLRNRLCCCCSLTSNQYLTRMMPLFFSRDSKPGTILRKSAYCLSIAEFHHVLDEGPVIPAAIEKHYFTCRRQLLHVTLGIQL